MKIVLEQPTKDQIGIWRDEIRKAKQRLDQAEKLATDGFWPKAKALGDLVSEAETSLLLLMDSIEPYSIAEDEYYARHQPR